MRNTGTLRLRLVALGVAAALGSTAALAQQQRDPSPIERDRAAVSENDSLDSQAESDRLGQDRQAQRDSEISPSQQRAGQSPGLESDTQRQAGQQPRDELGQQPSLDQDRDLQASDSDRDSAGSGAFDTIGEQHDDLGTFVELIKAAGLEDSLTSGTEYTVFAPTDEAFEAELEAMGKTKEELMSAEGREDLVALLRAHIVADDVDQEMARNLSEARTIDGGSVSLKAEGEELMVGDAKVVASDIQEGSLRVYAIDGVLEPNAPAQAAAASDRSSQIEGDQPAASVQAPRGEQPQASTREAEEDEPEPLLN